LHGKEKKIMKKGFLIFFASLMFIACNNHSASEATSTDTIHDTVFQKPDTAASNQTPPANSSEADGNTVLIAGESVGKISLGTDASTLQSILGKPDMSDAAMGKAWTTWYGKKRDEHNNKTELNVYTAYKDTSMREQTVQQIRTTSSFFVTADSIHVYSSLDDIENKYAVKKAAQYKSSDGRTITVYDDKKNGIAFEIVSANTQNICTGIIIHAKNKSVNDIYIMLHPDMKRFDK
jgi:hypothetical protein